MTIKQLYEKAVKVGVENMPIAIVYPIGLFKNGIDIPKRYIGLNWDEDPENSYSLEETPYCEKAKANYVGIVI